MPINNITNFKILTNKPIDDRLVYSNYDTMIQYFTEHPKRVYEGLLLYCEEEQRYYNYASEDWHVFEPIAQLQTNDPVYIDENTIKVKYDNTTIVLDSSGYLSTNVNNHFLGWYELENDLPISASSGDYAIVKESGNTIWMWSTDHWIDSEVVEAGVQSISTVNGGVESGNVTITPYKIGAVSVEDADNFGDMFKEVYDTDNDGIIDRSELADKITSVDSAQNNQFYGKDESGNIGFHTITSGSASVSWNDVTDKPVFDDVATSGDYNDLDNTPDIPSQLSELYDDETHRLVTDELIEYWNSKQDYVTYPTEFEVKSNKGIANGYAPLDHASKVPKTNLPDDLGDMTKVVYDILDRGYVDKSDIAVKIEGIDTSGSQKYYGTDETGTPGFYDVSYPTESPIYELKANKSQINGYASLDGSGKVPYSELPALTINSTLAGNCADIPATADVGTVYICTDTGSTWLYDGSTWLEFNVSADGSILIINTPYGGNKTGPTASLSLSDFTERILAYATSGVTTGWLASFSSFDELETVYSVATSLDPIGSDLKIPSEKAVRDAISLISTEITDVVKNVNGNLPDEYGRVDITKVDVGLGNVDNVAQMYATTGMVPGRIPVWVDTGKILGNGYSVSNIVSTVPSTNVIVTEKAIRDALDEITVITVDADLSSSSTNPLQNRVVYQELLKKVDKVVGKGLSTNDLTNALLNKINSIQEGAEVNVQSDWTDEVPTSDAFIKNKPGIATLDTYGFLPGYSASDYEKFLKVTETGIAWEFPTVNADTIVYDPASTTLVSDNVQDALDELWLNKMGKDLVKGSAWVGNDSNIAEAQKVATIPPWEANMFLKSSPVEGVFTFGSIALDIVESPYYLRKDGGNAVEGNISWGNFLLTNLGDATSDDQAANLGVVKEQITGFYWKAPVEAIVASLPDYISYTEEDYVALTTGYIYVNNGSGWTQVSSPREGNVIYNIIDKTIYFWDGTIWSKIVGLGSSSNTGVLLQDGSATLTDNWELNDEIHNFTIRGVPNATELTDVTNKRDIVNEVSLLSFANSVATIETESSPVSESGKGVGYRYITYEDGTIREKIDDTTWITIDPKQGRIVYCDGDERLYVYTGVLWNYIETILQGSLLDLSSITIDHHDLTNIDVFDDHLQYLPLTGIRSMSGNLNMGSNQIKFLTNATADSDAVTFGQMKSLVNGANWIQSVTGFYNSPPTGSQFPRVIVGQDPTGEFVGYSNYIASYTMPSGPWLFSYYPATGDAVLCTAAGELNNKNDQYSFNGTDWVLFFQGQSHDSLIGADTSTIHSKYLRNDHSDVSYGMITFTPTGFSYPFTVLKTGKVANLNADRVDDYHVSEDPVSSTVVARNSEGTAKAHTILTDKVIINGYDAYATEIYTQSLIDTTTTHRVVDYTTYYDHTLSFDPANQNGHSIFDINYDYVRLNGVIIAEGLGLLNAITLDNQPLEYFMPASASLSSLTDVLSTLNPEDHQVLAYYASESMWGSANINEISSTPHYSLTNLTTGDDHTQYMMTDGTRHDVLSRHVIGTSVPYIRLNGDMDDVTITSPSDKQILMYDGVTSNWINSYVQSGIFDHEYTLNVASSIAHKEYLRIDGSYMMSGNLSIGNNPDYQWVDYKGVTRYANEFRNRYINLGQFVDITGYTGGSWNKDSYGVHYNGANKLSLTIKQWDEIEDEVYTRYIMHVGDEVYNGYDGIEFTREGSSVFRALYNSDILSFNGYRVWHEGMERTTGDALKGLNAELLCGKTPDELFTGGSVNHSLIIGNIHVNDYPTGEISDYHPQYLTFGYASTGITSSNRHNNQSLHQFGGSVPRPYIGNITNPTSMADVVISSLASGDFLKFNGSTWYNGPIDYTSIDHDNIATAESNAHDTRYYRKITSTQSILGLFVFPKIDISVGVDNYYVPFTVPDGCNTVPYLDADKVDGYDASAFVKNTGTETIVGNKTFSSYLDATDKLRIPTQNSDFIATITQDRLLFINSENGQLEYTYLDNTGQLNVIALATNGGTISGTMSEDFYIGGPSALFLYDQIKESVHGLAVKNGAGSTTFINCKDIYSDDTNIVENDGENIYINNVILDGGVLTW